MLEPVDVQESDVVVKSEPLSDHAETSCDNTEKSNCDAATVSNYAKSDNFNAFIGSSNIEMNNFNAIPAWDGSKISDVVKSNKSDLCKDVTMSNDDAEMFNSNANVRSQQQNSCNNGELLSVLQEQLLLLIKKQKILLNKIQTSLLLLLQQNSDVFISEQKQELLKLQKLLHSNHVQQQQLRRHLSLLVQQHPQFAGGNSLGNQKQLVDQKHLGSATGKLLQPCGFLSNTVHVENHEISGDVALMVHEIREKNRLVDESPEKKRLVEGSASIGESRVMDGTESQVKSLVVQCRLCDHMTSNLRDMRRHIRSRHKTRPRDNYTRVHPTRRFSTHANYVPVNSKRKKLVHEKEANTLGVITIDASTRHEMTPICQESRGIHDVISSSSREIISHPNQLLFLPRANHEIITSDATSEKARKHVLGGLQCPTRHMFSCPHCIYSTHRRDHIRIHVARHTRDGYITCDICNVYSTCRKDHMKRHMNSCKAKETTR